MKLIFFFFFSRKKEKQKVYNKTWTTIAAKLLNLK